MFLLSNRKVSVVKARWQKLYPAHESRGRDGPTKWCRWMATFLRRVNGSDFPSSGVRCAGHLQQGVVCKRHDAIRNRKTRFSSNRSFTSSSVITNSTFWIQSPKPNLLFILFFPLFPFSDTELMIQTISCVRDAPLRWWRVDSVCGRRKCIFLVWRMLPFCTLNGLAILHVQDAPLRWWCEDIVWTNLRMNYISFTHTLFCVCSDSGMSRCS